MLRLLRPRELLLRPHELLLRPRELLSSSFSFSLLLPLPPPCDRLEVRLPRPSLPPPWPRSTPPLVLVQEQAPRGVRVCCLRFWLLESGQGCCVRRPVHCFCVS